MYQIAKTLGSVSISETSYRKFSQRVEAKRLICILNSPIALSCDMRLHGTAAEAPVKFQSDEIIKTANRETS